jgi:SPP1 family predicted phage head-tail adaptor
MIEPSIGELRHRLGLQAPLLGADGSGGAVVSWSLVAEVWAAVRTTRAGEFVLADRLQSVAGHEVWLRARADVTPDMRFLWGPRVLEIKGVIEVGSPPRWLRCLVEERAP